MSHALSISQLFLSSAAIGFFIAFVAVLIFQREGWKDSLPLLVALSLMGSCAGLAGGMSRDSAVEDIIPVFLGLVGAVAVYLFGLDRSRGVIASLGLTALTVALLISYASAAEQRNVSEDHRNLRAHCARAYTDAELLQNKVAYSVFEAKLGNQCSKALCWFTTSVGAVCPSANPKD